MEKGFEVVSLSAREKGLLKTIGNREIVVSAKTVQGADNADNEWLMETMRTVYMQYYSRVAEYRNMEGL